MIKIEAFVREDKFEDVKEALAKIEVHGITVYQVMGCGSLGKEDNQGNSNRSIYGESWRWQNN